MKTSLPLTTLLVLGNLQAYDLHEWGTFTTVSGSDGILLGGLEREEESLPGYVHAHPGFAQPSGPAHFLRKAIQLPVANVKVKMETPVIYFHSAGGFRATVGVGFNGGTISQWYPERSGGEILPKQDPETNKVPVLNFSKPYTGSIEWRVDVLSRQDSRDALLFKPGDNLQWTHARTPEANAIRSDSGETEGFLFYRGLGSFDPGLITTVSDDGTLHLTNRSGGGIPYLLVFERAPDGTSRWMETGPLAADGETHISNPDFNAGKEGFDINMYQSLRDGLAACGLMKSEADAMVRTWWKSYFETPGLRVFWVLPEERTAAILPLTVTPAPAKTVRVLVGRSEVLRPELERQWLTQSLSADPDQAAVWAQVVGTDRFGLAFQERITALQAQAGK